MDWGLLLGGLALVVACFSVWTSWRFHKDVDDRSEQRLSHYKRMYLNTNERISDHIKSRGHV